MWSSSAYYEESDKHTIYNYNDIDIGISNKINIKNKFKFTKVF